MPRQKRTEVEMNALQEKFLDINEPVDSEEEGETVEEALKQKVSVAKKKEYEGDTLIPCRSIVQGYMNFKGTKSGTVYQWEGVNDVTNIEYQDLRAAMVSRSPYIMRPYFVIDNEELISLPEWKDVKAVYDKLYSKKDLTEIFKIQSADRMGQVLRGLPEGARKQMGSLAKDLMERGVLDSISKIKKIDEVLGTNLLLFIDKE